MVAFVSMSPADSGANVSLDSAEPCVKEGRHARGTTAKMEQLATAMGLLATLANVSMVSWALIVMW